MGKAKRSRKIKSANKLLKRQRIVCQALATAQMTCVTLAANATINAIRANVMQNGGNREGALAVINEMSEEIIDYKQRAEAKNTIIQICDLEGNSNGIKILQEKLTLLKKEL